VKLVSHQSRSVVVVRLQTALTHLYNLHQHVRFPAHISSNVLDLILLRDGDVSTEWQIGCSRSAHMHCSYVVWFLLVSAVSLLLWPPVTCSLSVMLLTPSAVRSRTVIGHCVQWSLITYSYRSLCTMIIDHVQLTVTAYNDHVQLSVTAYNDHWSRTVNGHCVQWSRTVIGHCVQWSLITYS